MEPPQKLGGSLKALGDGIFDYFLAMQEVEKNPDPFGSESDKPTPPGALVTFWEWDSLGRPLPLSGGWLEQPDYLMRILSTVERAVGKARDITESALVATSNTEYKGPGWPPPGIVPVNTVEHE